MRKLTWLLLFLFILSNSGFGSTQLKVETRNAGPNQAARFQASITNTSQFVGFQFDLVFPSVLISSDTSVKLTYRANGHSLAASLIEPGRLRIIAYSLSQTPFQGDSGSVVTIDFRTGTVPGNYEMRIENAAVSDSSQMNILSEVNNGLLILEAPNIAVSPGIYDFGRIPLLQQSSTTISITNTGNTDLNIDRLSSNRPEYFFPDSSGFTVPPGGTISRAIYFRSSKRGTISGSVKIYSDDPDQQIVSVSMQALAFAVNEVRAGSVSGRSGYPLSLPVRMNNMDSIVGFQMELALPAIAKYLSGSIQLSARKSDHVVTADTIGNLLRIIAYSPSNASFHDSDGVILNLDLLIQGMGGQYSIPIQTGIISDKAGSNVTSALYDGSIQIISPMLTVSQTNLPFGNVSSRDTAAIQISLTNSGSDTLNISSFQSDNINFWNNLSLPIKLAPGNSQTGVIRFHSSLEGNYSGRLTLRSNDYPRDPTFVDMSANVYLPNLLRILPAQGFTDGNATLQLDLDNMKTIVGFQFDLEVPLGLSFDKDSVRLTSRRDGHELTVMEIASGIWRVISYSLGNRAYRGSSGIILEIPLNLGNTPGVYSLTLQNVVLSDSSGKNVASQYFGGNVTVIIAPPLTPILVNPSNDANQLPIVLTLNWQRALRASTYWLQVSTDSLFNTLVVNDSTLTDTSKTLASLSFSMKYYWHVKSKNIGGESGYSTVYSFETIIITTIAHSIILHQGWNMISSFVTPKDSTLDTLFAKVKSKLVIAKNNMGQVYWSAFTINTIGKWKRYHGYQVYMSLKDTLTVIGEEITPQQFPIAMPQGWNMVSYLRNSAMRSDTALITLGSNIVIAKNNMGQVYWPAFSINTIGSMKPGQGYQMYLSSAGILIYPNNASPCPPTLLTKKVLAENTLSIPEPTKYRVEYTNTGSSANLMVEGNGIKDREEIGVWTQEKKLVGSGVVANGKALVTIWGDDEMTERVKEGAGEGETLLLSAWSGKERTLKVSVLLNGLTNETEEKSLLYKKDAVWIVRVEEAIEAIPTEFALEQNYPNPFNPLTTIRYALPKDTRVILEIYDLLGRKISTLIKIEQKAGYFSVQFQNRSLVSGVYFYTIVAGEFRSTKKFVVIK